MAPTAIARDFTTFDHLEHALCGSGWHNADLAQAASNPRLTAALEHVAEYLKRHCGIG